MLTDHLRVETKKGLIEGIVRRYIHKSCPRMIHKAQYLQRVLPSAVLNNELFIRLNALFIIHFIHMHSIQMNNNE